MQRLRIFLAPLALFSVGKAIGAEREGIVAARQQTMPDRRSPLWRSRAWQPDVWQQVRIEQHFRIRITPGTATMPPAIIEEIEQQERVERGDPGKVNRCLAIPGIAAVRPGKGDDLLLFLRDDRVVAATLQKRCSARDFYSGFLMEPNADGAICVGRDILHSRSGENCKVRRFHEVIQGGSRRFP